MRVKKDDLITYREITTSLADSVQSWLGDAVKFDAFQTPQVRSYGHSFILRYQYTLQDSHIRYLLVKVPHRPNQTDLQAALEEPSLSTFSRREYDLLFEIWKAFENIDEPDCIAIQPLAFLERWNAIVMLEIAAMPLRSMLMRPQVSLNFSHDAEKFIQYLRIASRWLRYYHDRIGEAEAESLSLDLMQARLDKISQDVANHIGERYGVVEKLNILQRKIQNFSGSDMTARLHGDFHCTNILVTPDEKICVLDPRAKSTRSSVYHDLATLLIDLSLKPIPVLTGGIFSNSFLEKCQQAVVESYFNPNEFEPDLLDFYCACEAIFKWSMDERDFRYRRNLRKVAPIARPVMAKYMQGLTNRYV